LSTDGCTPYWLSSLLILSPLGVVLLVSGPTFGFVVLS
jgi:hypothetical protein